MFGGLLLLINGDMAVAARGQGGLLVRVDAVDGAAWTKEEGVLPMVMRRREMDGRLRVVGDLTDRELQRASAVLPPRRPARGPVPTGQVRCGAFRWSLLLVDRCRAGRRPA